MLLPYGKQFISEEDIDAVATALRSSWLTTGPMVDEFEAKFAERIGARHAIAVSNATTALHLAMLTLGIGPGDRVITSPNTFLASANAAAYVAATPDFVDIDPLTFNLDPNCLMDNWSSDTRCVVAVDYGGQTADMPRIAEIARSNKAFVIEDACHAVGGSFEHLGREYRVGGHPWADITTFSFHPVKTMTTGEGGMLTTNDDEIARRARLLRTHGIERNAERFLGLGESSLAEQGPWYYEMHELGFNYRITDFQCALGLSQLGQLNRFISRRREIVAQYNQHFADLPHVSTPGLRNARDRDLTSWHLYTLQIEFPKLGMNRTEFMKALRDQGVGTQVLYIPVYLQPWYQRTYGYRPGKCPLAEKYYQQALSIPLFPGMSDEDVQHTINTVRNTVLKQLA